MYEGGYVPQDMYEQGAWIIDEGGGEYSFQPWTPRRFDRPREIQDLQIYPSPRPANAIGSVHTHPVGGYIGIRAFPVQPSRVDFWNYQWNYDGGVAGIGERPDYKYIAGPAGVSLIFGRKWFFLGTLREAIGP